MRVSDLIVKGRVIPELKASGKCEALEELVDALSASVRWLDREKFLQAVLAREANGSTGIGHGVAIPHAAASGMDEIAVMVGRSAKGIDFNSMDGLPVRIFFLVAVPKDSTAARLKILASISRLLKETSVRDRLIAAPNEAAIMAVISEEEGARQSKPFDVARIRP